MKSSASPAAPTDRYVGSRQAEEKRPKARRRYKPNANAAAGILDKVQEGYCYRAR
jgi:hypothetical protein